MDQEFKKIQSVIESEDMRKAFKENFPDEYNEVLREEAKLGPILFAGVVIIGAIIAKIVNTIKKKQTKDVEELKASAKTLEDKFVKVNDLFNNDNKVKLKLFGKRIDCDIESVVLIAKGDPSKTYKLIYDVLMYDSEYFVKEINNTVDSINKMSADKKTESINSYTDKMLTTIKYSFMQNHGYVEEYDPYLKVSHFKNQKASEVLKVYKQWIDWIDQASKIYDNNLSVQLQYYQLLEQAYNNMINKHGKDKEFKVMIDTIFQQLIKNSMSSMDFNSRALTIINDMAKFYIKELDSLKEQFKA